MKMGKNKKSGLGKFLLGAGIGAGIAMLFTKNTGKENREQLKKKIDDLILKIKSIDSKEVKENIEKKLQQLKVEIQTMDKEKALNIAKTQAKKIADLSLDLVNYVKEKGTPVMEKAADAVREKSIALTKEILNKLEKNEA